MRPCRCDDDTPRPTRRTPAQSARPLTGLLWLVTGLLLTALLMGAAMGMMAFVAFRTFVVLQGWM